ncbi:MAG: hypothetical protein JRJ29_01255 [Deltaproteobacteria bacterium]|nr:hypothetical protein [Deltaproteobacteria bacterium]
MIWKELAWDGVRFVMPADWDAAKLGPGYVMLENEFGPVMELRSRAIKGVFSPRDQLKKLRSAQDKQLGGLIQEIALPQAWREPLKPFRAFGFSWKGEGLRGKGLVIYCPTCKRVTAIQFFEKGKPGTGDALSARVLESFQDHRTDNRVLWAVFDIHALVPSAYRLTRHRFEPGEFEMVFSRRVQKITLHRWAPASALMGEGGLFAFLEKLPYLHKKKFQEIQAPEIDGLEWNEEPCSTLFGRVRWIRNLKPSLRRFRLWHVEEKNRILGVGYQGRGNIEPALFDRVCKEYVCI